MLGARLHLQQALCSLPDDVNVFGRNRRLIRPLLCTLDGGGEFGAEYQERVKQLDPAIRTRTNAPNQPDLNSYVERVIGSLRQHLRQSVEGELGDIESRSVQRSLDWPERVRRAEAAGRRRMAGYTQFRMVQR